MRFVKLLISLLLFYSCNQENVLQTKSLQIPEKFELQNKIDFQKTNKNQENEFTAWRYQVRRNGEKFQGIAIITIGADTPQISSYIEAKEITVHREISTNRLFCLKAKSPILFDNNRREKTNGNSIDAKGEYNIVYDAIEGKIVYETYDNIKFLSNKHTIILRPGEKTNYNYSLIDFKEGRVESTFVDEYLKIICFNEETNTIKYFRVLTNEIVSKNIVNNKTVWEYSVFLPDDETFTQLFAINSNLLLYGTNHILYSYNAKGTLIWKRKINSFRNTYFKYDNPISFMYYWNNDTSSLLHELELKNGDENVYKIGSAHPFIKRPFIVKNSKLYFFETQEQIKVCTFNFLDSSTSKYILNKNAETIHSPIVRTTLTTKLIQKNI